MLHKYVHVCLHAAYYFGPRANTIHSNSNYLYMLFEKNNKSVLLKLHQFYNSRFGLYYLKYSTVYIE